MMPRTKRYDGKDVSITFGTERCIHSEECAKRLPAVFDAHRRPWVEPNAAAASVIAEVVSHCPSGALHAYATDGSPTELHAGATRITVSDDGPLYLKGNINILAQDGSILSTESRATLCRCGRSENKPFCDNSHIGQFDASGPLDVTRSERELPDPSDLSVTPLKDGPYIVKGSFIMQSASSDQEILGSKGALCRCGHSNNKPFCDGTHRQIGFEAE